LGQLALAWSIVQLLVSWRWRSQLVSCWSVGVGVVSWSVVGQLALRPHELFLLVHVSNKMICNFLTVAKLVTREETLKL